MDDNTVILILGMVCGNIVPDRQAGYAVLDCLYALSSLFPT